MHCLPADISGVSCAEGEVAASVFDRAAGGRCTGSQLPALHHRGYGAALARKRNPADLLLDLLGAVSAACKESMKARGAPALPGPARTARSSPAKTLTGDWPRTEFRWLEEQ